MALPGRLKRDRGSNASFEALIPAIADLEDAVTNLQDQMTGMTQNAGGSLAAPAPAIPFKIAERSDNEGIFVTVAVLVPAATEVLRIQIIRKSDNQKKTSDADDTAAVKRVNRKLLKFELQISEQEQRDGVVEREIGPLKEKKSATDQAYQLIRLIATNDAGSKSKNPTNSPLNPSGSFAVGDQILPALVVAAGGITEFVVGNAVSDPPKTPALADIICNQVASEGQVANAKVTVRLWADQTTNKTFADVGATEAYVVFKLVGDTATQTVLGKTGEVDTRLKFGGPLEDPNVNFVLIDCLLTFGVQYEYKKAITANASGKQVATATGVNFVAGKGGLVTTLINRSLITSPRDPHHTLLTLTFTQPGSTSDCDNPAAYIKRIEYFVKEDNDADYVFEKKLTGLDEESYAIAGRVVTIKTKIKHKANQAAIAYKARIVGVGRDPIGAGNFVDVLSSFGSQFSGLPGTPQVGDIIRNDPDDDTEENDAFTVFAVYASQDRVSTFRQVGADAAYVVLRRKKNAATTSQGDDTLTDNALAKYGGPIDPSDLDQAFAQVTVRRLKLGRRYLWVRNIITSQGSPAKGNVGNAPFIAGFGTNTADSTDIGRLTFVPPLTIKRLNKHHSRITLTFKQPNTGNPVLLKNAKLFQRLPTNFEGQTEPNAVIKDKEVLKESPEYSSNTIAQDLQPDVFTKQVMFTAQHPVNTTGIAYYAELRSIAGGIAYIGNNFTVNTIAGLSETIDGNTGGGLTGIGPSPPATIRLSSTATGPDKNDGKAVLTVVADWNGSASTGKTFAQVGADECIAVLRRNTDTGDTLKFGGALTAEQLNLTSIDIECPGLRVGKTYTWVKNVLKSTEGVRQNSIGISVDFVAGNYSSDPNALSGLILSFQQQDARHSLVNFDFNQSSPPVFLRKIRLLESQTGVPGDVAKVVDRVDAMEDVDTNGNSYNTAGGHRATFIIKHKRPPNVVSCAGQLLLVGSDTPKQSSTFNLTVIDTDDTGIPFYNGSNANTPDQTNFAFVKLRWKPAHLRGHIRLPTNNMASFDRVKVRFYIGGLSDGTTYVWNPDETEIFTSNGTPDPLPDTQVYGDNFYTLDLGQTGHVQTNADRPDLSGKGVEFPQVAYNRLVDGTSFVQVTFFIYNSLSSPGSSFSFVKQRLIYSPNNQLRWLQSP